MPRRIALLNAHAAPLAARTATSPGSHDTSPRKAEPMTLEWQPGVAVVHVDVFVSRLSA